MQTLEMEESTHQLPAAHTWLLGRIAQQMMHCTQVVQLVAHAGLCPMTVVQRQIQEELVAL